MANKSNTTNKRTKVAAIQICSTHDVEKNLATTLSICHAAIQEGAELLLVPEAFAYLGREEGKLDIAEPLPQGGPIFERCSRFARTHGVELILGGFWEKGDDPIKVRNCCIYLGTDGKIKAMYRKIHLFDIELSDGTVVRESDTIEAGDTPMVAQAPFGRLGLSICYDLRFPELYRQLVNMGATAFVVPAAFTRSTGMDHWHLLLRARAVESQSYVIAANQNGHHFGSRFSYGHSLICDPWGCILSECGEAEGFAIAHIDPQIVSRVREQLPALQHRRIGINAKGIG